MANVEISLAVIKQCACIVRSGDENSGTEARNLGKWIMRGLAETMALQIRFKSSISRTLVRSPRFSQ